MVQDFLPADRPDLSAAALAVIDLFTQRGLPHDEAATVALAAFVGIASAHECCQDRSATAAQNVANWLRIRATRAASAARVQEDSARSSRSVPMRDQQRLTQSVDETHNFLISMDMPLWQYLDTLVTLYVSAINAHPEQSLAAHQLGARLQYMFPLRAATPTRTDGPPVTH